MTKKAMVQRLALPVILGLLVLQACNVTLPVKDGQTAYDLKKFALAADLLQEDYDKAKTTADKFDIAGKIARSYLAFSRPDLAEGWWKKAVDLDHDPAVLFDYALTLKQNEKYAEAIEALNLFYQYDRSQRLAVEGHIAACREIMEAMEGETYTTLSNLEDLNTRYGEYAPFLWENMLIYSHNQAAGEDVPVDEWTGGSYADIRGAVALSRDRFRTEDPWEPEFNSPFHEATLVYNAEHTELFFTRCGTNDDNKDVCRIFWSYKEFDEWSPPEELPLFGDSVNTGHPFLSADGKELFFSSDETFGYGGKDLYVSPRIGREWGAPLNLGPRVNTAGDELFPSIGPDGKLYFSSTGHFGYGGLDLFTAERRGRMFTQVQSLGYPVNTGADDFAAFIMPSEDDSVEATGYFTSNRKGGKGGDDLYFFEKRLAPAPKLPPPVFLLEGLVEENTLADPANPNSAVTGRQALAGVSAELSDVTDAGRPYLIETLRTGEDGLFKAQLDQDASYELTFNKPGYFADRQYVNTIDQKAEDGDTIVLQLTVLMEKIYKEVEFTINNIYYDLDSFNIRPDAALVLDSLATILTDNPGLRVELGSHTDARGSDPYNLELSQKRAESAVAYLISRGIAAERLTARGYGETRLVNECGNGVTCPEPKHQENRRTTFKILGFDFRPVPEE